VTLEHGAAVAAVLPHGRFAVLPRGPTPCRWRTRGW
jgi:hypothetical protein